MSMQTTSKMTLNDRIDVIHEKAKEAEELYEDAQQIETKRAEATKKNRAFDDLKQEFANVQGQLQSTKQWVDVAQQLGVEVDSKLNTDLIVEIKNYADRFSQRSYEGFENEEKIDSIQERVESKRKKLKELTREIRDDAQSIVSDLLQSVLQKETLLKIPDIGSKEDQQVCDDLKTTLKSIKRGDISFKTAEIYRKRREEYDALEISLDKYDLTNEAEEVIWNLLDDETVTLADIDEAVLSDLKTLEEFSNKLSIQFKS